MFAEIHNFQQFVKTLSAQLPEDVDYPPRESAVIAGQPGRRVVISGADQLVHRVKWAPIGKKVQRLDAAGNPTCTLTMLAGESRRAVR